MKTELPSFIPLFATHWAFAGISKESVFFNTSSLGPCCRWSHCMSLKSCLMIHNSYASLYVNISVQGIISVMEPHPGGSRVESAARAPLQSQTCKVPASRSCGPQTPEEAVPGSSCALVGLAVTVLCLEETPPGPCLAWTVTSYSPGGQEADQGAILP